MINIIFFGSFLHYSAIILEKLIQAQGINILGVVTTPPQPTGKNKELKKTEVQEMAEKHQLPVYAPEKLNEKTLLSLQSTFEPRNSNLVFLTAGYGKLLPKEWLTYPSGGALNLHFSLLPAYRGANPAEWAILRGETQTGVTLIEMSPEFDTGKMVAQASLSIEADDTRETVYEKLYELGGEVLPEVLIEYQEFKENRRRGSKKQRSTETEKHRETKYFLPPIEQPSSPTPYAKRLVREDGFIAWEAFIDAMAGRPVSAQYLSPQLQQIAHSIYEPLEFLELAFVERAVRALSGFPGVWTVIPTAKGPKRMKILEVKSEKTEETKLLLEKVQVEGQQATGWNQVKNITLVSSSE